MTVLVAKAEEERVIAVAKTGVRRGKRRINKRLAPMMSIAVVAGSGMGCDSLPKTQPI